MSESLTERTQQLRQWLASLDDFSGLVDQPLVPASSDASFRRYFRIASDENSFIVMDAPPEKENCRPFVKIAGQLHQAGINAPSVLAQDHQHGFLLLSDLGSETGLQALHRGVDPALIYAPAIETLVTMQTGIAPDSVPPYDAGLLTQEMNLFADWLLERHLGLNLPAPVRRRLGDTFSLLRNSALAQATVFVHRDYHSRNLMWKDDELGVLDFQDAVCGPLTYDLVSLLKDCYITWPAEQVAIWLDQYLESAHNAGIVLPDRARFVSDFELMGVQRHLKASGIFARLWHRDHKAGYLDDIPNTLAHVMALQRTEPEIRFLQQLIGESVMPALQRISA